jgi:hypothetical protein
VGQVGHQCRRGVRRPPIVPPVPRKGGQPPPPASARPACPPLSPCHARGGGQSKPSSDAVSHLSHLVPLLRNKNAATNSHYAMSHVSHRVPLPSGSARARARRDAQRTPSKSSRAIGWRRSRETGRRSRGRRAVETRVRLVLARWRRATSAAGLRRASRTQETRIQTKRFGAACEHALWSSEHRQLRRVPCWPLARTLAGIDQIVM